MGRYRRQREAFDHERVVADGRDVLESIRHAIARDIAVNNQRRATMAKPDIWKDEKNGQLFHGFCFEEGESRDGFSQLASLDELDDDDSCESCGGVFLVGVVTSGITDDDEVDDDDDED